MLIILDLILAVGLNISEIECYLYNEAVGLNISEIECYLYNEARPNWLKLFEGTFEYLGGNLGGNEG